MKIEEVMQQEWYPKLTAASIAIERYLDDAFRVPLAEWGAIRHRRLQYADATILAANVLRAAGVEVPDEYIKECKKRWAKELDEAMDVRIMEEREDEP